MLENSLNCFSAAFVSTKGGVGKTTLCANLGGLLAGLGYRVLLVDADPQPTLSTYYPIREAAQRGFTDVCRSGRITAAHIAETEVRNLDVVVSDDTQNELPTFLSGRFDGRERLARALERVREDDLYDFVLIDTPGAEGIMQDVGVAAADVLISPLPPESLPVREYWRGTVEMLQRLAESRMRVAHLPLKTVFNRMTRTRDAAQVASAVRELVSSHYRDHGGRLSVLDNVIWHAKSYTEAATLQIPVHRHEPFRNGEMPSASATLHRLAWEIWPHLAGERDGETDA